MNKDLVFNIQYWIVLLKNEKTKNYTISCINGLKHLLHSFRPDESLLYIKSFEHEKDAICQKNYLEGLDNASFQHVIKEYNPKQQNLLPYVKLYLMGITE